MTFFQRLQDVLGIGESYEDEGYEDELYDEEYVYPEGYSERQGYGRRRVVAEDAGANKVVGMPRLPAGQPEVVLMEPRTFEEIPQAVRALRERKSVVLNLGMMDPDQAQRAADYVAGGAYAVDGHQERLGDHIFLFTPSFVQISSYSGIPPLQPQSATMAQVISPSLQGSTQGSTPGVPFPNPSL
ncbi:cell division protein SepF [Leptolyngbya sp. AN02str]|uniref:cell division protein SepF n=1 Tax=Leptolyngbya sp. AN02str TaxID=3423363 RepID=UPI003D317AA5